MALSNKVLNEKLREGYLNAIEYYFEKEEEVLRIKSNEVAIPVIDEEDNEKWIVITVKVPTGAKDEPFDGYVEAEDYAHKLKEKEIKAKKKEEEKKKKIEHDKKMREMKEKKDAE